MASTIFDFVAAELERQTNLASLEARGTVRLALKQAGLEPHTVTAEQMAVMLERLMPHEISTRGIENAEEICASLVKRVKESQFGSAPAGPESPESIFRRLAQG